MKRSAGGSIQIAYNEKHGITPQTVRKKVRDVIEATKVAEEKSDYVAVGSWRKCRKKERAQADRTVGDGNERSGAKHLQFERAAELRDAIWN